MPPHGATLSPWLVITGQLVSLKLLKQRQLANLLRKTEKLIRLTNLMKTEGLVCLRRCLSHVYHLTDTGLLINTGHMLTDKAQ